jgi:hypothetical protein
MRARALARMMEVKAARVKVSSNPRNEKRVLQLLSQIPPLVPLHRRPLEIHHLMPLEIRLLRLPLNMDINLKLLNSLRFEKLAHFIYDPTLIHALTLGQRFTP